jgi:hypothetical protein
MPALMPGAKAFAFKPAALVHIVLVLFSELWHHLANA